MSDPSRVITGYDCEFLIGGDYFAHLLGAMFRSSGGFFGIDSYRVKGTLTPSSFKQIEGMDQDRANALYAYLTRREWLDDYALADGFDPLDPDLQAYLAEFGQATALAVTDHLRLVTLAVELTIEEPYRSTLFDDDLPVAELLRKVFVTVTEDDVDRVAAAMTTMGHLDADGRLTADFEAIRAELSAWLDEVLPTHRLGFLDTIKAAQVSDLSLRDLCAAALIPLPDAKLDALLEFMADQQLLTSGGRLRQNMVRKIGPLLGDWLESELPSLKSDLLAALKDPPALAIHFPIDLHGTHAYGNGTVRLFEGERNEIILFLPFELTGRAILLGTPIVCHESVHVLDHFGALVERPGLGGMLPDLFAFMPRQIDLDLTPSGSVTHIDFKKLKSYGPYAPAYGIYCNLNLDLRALPTPFELESYNRPRDVVGARVEIDPDGHLAVKDKDGEAIDPARFLYSSDAPGENADTLLYHVVGNVALQTIGLDDDGHLVVTTKNGKTPSPAEIVALADRNPPRGNIDKAGNFLRQGYDYAVGIGQPVLRRYETSLWNGLYVPSPEDAAPAGNPNGLQPVRKWRRYMVDKYGEKLGIVHDIDLHWRDGHIECVVEAEYFVSFALLPNADVHCVVAIQPRIRDHALTFDAQVKELTADTGLAGDVAALLMGGLLFAPFAIAFGFPALLVLGVPGLEIAESVLADTYKDDAEDLFGDRTAQVFDAIPRVLEVFTKPGDDAACYLGYGPSQLYDKAFLDDAGMVLTGRSGIGEVYHTRPVSLVGRSRAATPSWDLVDLLYRDGGGTQVAVPADYAAFRVRQRSLARVTLTPVAQFRRDGRIHSLKFSSGVDLRVEEIIRLMRDRVVEIPRVRIHVSSTGHEYLRSKQDIVKGNNLSALPNFRPADLPRN